MDFLSKLSNENLAELARVFRRELPTDVKKHERVRIMGEILLEVAPLVTRRPPCDKGKGDDYVEAADGEKAVVVGDQQRETACMAAYAAGGNDESGEQGGDRKGGGEGGAGDGTDDEPPLDGDGSDTDGEEDTMEITVRDMLGGLMTFEVAPSDSVHSLKVQVRGRTDIMTRQQHLTFAGQELKNGHSLKSYKIQQKSVLDLVLDVIGGAGGGGGRRPAQQNVMRSIDKRKEADRHKQKSRKVLQRQEDDEEEDDENEQEEDGGAGNEDELVASKIEVTHKTYLEKCALIAAHTKGYPDEYINDVVERIGDMIATLQRGEDALAPVLSKLKVHEIVSISESCNSQAVNDAKSVRYVSSLMGKHFFAKDHSMLVGKEEAARVAKGMLSDIAFAARTTKYAGHGGKKRWDKDVQNTVVDLKVAERSPAPPAGAAPAPAPAGAATPVPRGMFSGWL